MRHLHKFLIGILLLAAAVAGYNLAYLLHPPQPQPLPAVQHDSPDELLGRQRPEFSLPDLTGRPRSVTEWDGRVLLINFWATWCAPCREEIPAFIKVRRQFQDRGFEILGIAIDHPEYVTEYARDLGITYPLLYGEEEAVAVGSLYGNRQGTLPYSVFLDTQGRIRHIHNRGVLTEFELIPIVESLLAASVENEPKRTKLP